ncbi:hypothetical protein ACFWUT_13330 [Streptomyces cyaneofuscatus]
MGVLQIVTAARRLFPGEIRERFAIVGHSQGGQAACSRPTTPQAGSKG